MSEGVRRKGRAGARRGRTRDAGARGARGELARSRTRPSRLYPHQWSWDSACIAMGYARWNQVGGARAPLASRASGRTASCRTSSSLRAAGRYFPGPEFWQPGGPPTLRRVWTPRASCSRPSTRRRRCASMSCRESASRRSRSWKSSRRSSARGTRTSTASGRGGDDGLVEIWHPGSPAWTTGRSGTRRSTGSTRPRTRSSTTSASTPSSWTRLSVRRTVNTTGTSTSSGSLRELDY